MHVFHSRSALRLPIIPTQLTCSCSLVLSIKGSVIMNPKVHLYDTPVVFMEGSEISQWCPCFQGSILTVPRVGEDYRLPSLIAPQTGTERSRERAPLSGGCAPSTKTTPSHQGLRLSSVMMGVGCCNFHHLLNKSAIRGLFWQDVHLLHAVGDFRKNLCECKSASNNSCYSLAALSKLNE